MSNDKKQTAVEWYVERLYDLEMANNQGLIMTNTYIKGKREAVEQAKEMEKEQIIEAHQEGQLDERDYWTIGDSLGKNRMIKSQMYYNKTYGGNK